MQGPNANFSPFCLLILSFHFCLESPSPIDVIVSTLSCESFFSFVNILTVDSDDKLFTEFQSCLLFFDAGISNLSTDIFSKGASTLVLSIFIVEALNGTGAHLYLFSSNPGPPNTIFVFSDCSNFFSGFDSKTLFSAFKVIVSLSPISIFLNCFLFCL